LTTGNFGEHVIEKKTRVEVVKNELPFFQEEHVCLVDYMSVK
jgi:hypothetical protein